jgi:hypothetical protein
MKKIMAILALSMSITGCETMLAHYTLSADYINRIALGNAGVNYCLSKGEIDKNLAYMFSNAAANVMDISVVDRQLYKQRYEAHLASAEREYVYGVCAEVERMLPKINDYLVNSYMDISRSIRAARAEEVKQMAVMAGNFNRTIVGAVPNYAATYSWPNVKYVEEPKTSNYLVQTSKGLIQCRVTEKSYVMCF